MLNHLKGAIFDLDGVIVDTAKYHYLAWKEMAEELGIEFTEQDNERLKGVSRMRSLGIVLEIGGMTLPQEEMERLAESKNTRYLEYIMKMDASEILPGVEQYLKSLRERGVQIALGSASKNAPIILERVGITALFDTIVDGNSVSKAKPDPEVFLVAAERLGLTPADCVVFEDAAAGVEAAKRAGIYAVGIGEADNLPGADLIVTGVNDLL